MRAKVEELEAQLGKELVVFIDGVRVAFPVEFDTKEGWCTALEYRLLDISKAEEGSAQEALSRAKTKTEEDLQTLEPIEIKIKGKVQIAYWEAEKNVRTPQN